MGASELTFGTWRKASYSGGNSNCVEVAHSAAAVGIRDSKSPDTGTLTVPRAAWMAFLATSARVAGLPERA
ncbi:transcriptional regulator [Saccharothrix sp. NRRL B-16348]|uniref:DUF397 domain-containing protein n=1 Tax=Saccharothrix sp. NRRL B-16348 TaxID=1415542 RepID=UPI0006AED1C9|nr:DUF397 domain-containing protein [Saccharothrix sp. NRRL B-16348]KOX11990.1 transcriptional regulator [Saccharothrix sp. NRRL B-16348]